MDVEDILRADTPTEALWAAQGALAGSVYGPPTRKAAWRLVIDTLIRHPRHPNCPTDQRDHGCAWCTVGFPAPFTWGNHG